jgi:hypothetical protein
MPHQERVEEVLCGVLCELVRLLIVLEDHPDEVYTGRLERLSREVLRHSAPLSNALMDVVAAMENLAVSCADLQEKNLRNTRCSCPPEKDLWFDSYPS